MARAYCPPPGRSGSAQPVGCGHCRRYGSGSTALVSAPKDALPIRTSKWRCGPSQLPVQPSCPTTCPAWTRLPEMYRGRLQHVHVDEAVVVGGAVDGEVIAPAAVIRVAVLPAIDHDAVVHRDLGRPGLAEDVLTLVDMAGARSAESGKLVPEVVRPLEREHVPGGKPLRCPLVDAEEGGAVGQGSVSGPRLEARQRQAHRRAEPGAQGEHDRDRKPGLRRRPGQAGRGRRTPAVLGRPRPPADRALDAGPHAQLSRRAPLGFGAVASRAARSRLGACAPDVQLLPLTLDSGSRSKRSTIRAPRAGALVPPPLERFAAFRARRWS